MNKSDKDPFVDMSSVNDNVLRPWARNPETDVKLDNAINGLNNILQMSAPQKFSGKQGYSTLDRTPDRIIALYEFAKSHPDWVDSFLDGMPPPTMNEQRPDENMLTAMENTIQEQDYYSDSAGSEGGDSSVEYSDDGGGDLIGDVDVLEAAFGLTGIAESLGPEFNDSFNDKRYLPNGNARFEADAQRRHSIYSRSKRLNKLDKKKENKKYASAQFMGRYRLSNSSMSLLPPQRQTKKKRRSKKNKAKQHRQSSSEVNILTINEAEPMNPDPPRPMTAEEFYDDSLDLLQPEPTLNSSFSDADYFSRPGTGTRPPTGYLQSGAAQLRAATPSGIPPSPLTSHRGNTPSQRLGTGANRPASSNGRPGSAFQNAERPSTAELPLLRPGTADRASGNQSRQALFSSASRTINTTKSFPANGGPARRPSTANSAGNRPSTTSSASRYDITKSGGIGGLAVVSRPQSRDGRAKGPTSKQTMYSDTAAQFFESGKTDNKFVPFVHREMSKLRSVRDQMRTMEGRMLAFSGNLGAVMDCSEDEYIQRKTTGVSPGGVEFKKKSLFPLDAQRKMTERIYRDAKEKAAVDHVEPRMKCDGYDRVVPPEKLYQSETQKFIINNDSYDNMRKTVRQGGFHIKQGELQEYAEEAQRLGKRPFEVGPGGMKC